jgi:hypothetical protein
MCLEDSLFIIFLECDQTGRFYSLFTGLDTSDHLTSLGNIYI